jgi:hypothetical protein
MTLKLLTDSIIKLPKILIKKQTLATTESGSLGGRLKIIIGLIVFPKVMYPKYPIPAPNIKITPKIMGNEISKKCFGFSNYE